MSYQSRETYKSFAGEKNDGKIIVETAGYIPAEKQIQNLMLAGQRLAAYRAEQYDYPDGKIDINARPDPTRRKDFDYADASMLQQTVTERLEEQHQNALDKQSEDLNENEDNKTSKTDEAPLKP